jgi:signal transduction histidine kinase
MEIRPPASESPQYTQSGGQKPGLSRQGRCAREPQVEFRRVDINLLLQQVIELTRARWSDMTQQRGIDIEVHTEFAPDLPAILGIESELRDAFTNLMFNAVDAMPRGGPLTLRTCLREKPAREDESHTLLRLSSRAWLIGGPPCA